MNAIVNYGIVIAGRPVITEFRAVSETKFVVEIPNPLDITDITFFLLPNSPLPPGTGAVLYFAVPPFENWQLLGSVFAEKPSAILRTSWASNPEIASHQIVQLGVSLESLESVVNMGIEASGFYERKAFAHKIAMDLFKYMASFSNSDNHQMMVIPTNLLDKWMQRFEAKYKRDPNFMMKNE